jgi:hypothetical protein
VSGNQRTVVRAGYGIFYNQELPASFGSPHNDTYPNLNVNVFDAFFAGLPLRFPLVEAVFDLAPPSSKAINVIDPKLRTPYAHQWSLNVQRDLGIGIAQVGYVGNAVRKMTAGGSITARNLNRVNPFTGQRPNPQLGDVSLIAGYPSSDYHALQASFKRSYSSGLAFNANYTWAHETDDAIGFFEDYQDPDHPELEHGNGEHDVRHNFTFDVSYDLPTSWFRVLPSALQTGWQVNSITQLRSGLPVNVTVTGGFFGGALRPDPVEGVDTRPSNYSLPGNQFNPDAFQSPPPGQYGTVGRNTLRGPGFAQVDLSLVKNTRIGDGTSVQVRLEAFNILNHPNFALPFSGLNRDPINNALAPSASFGQSFQTVGDELGGLLGAGGPRQIQLAVRFAF